MNSIYFEQAFNEQCRLYLKLAALFDSIEQGLVNPEPAASRLALESLLHVLTLLDRPDFKTKLIKELTRLSGVFQRLMHSEKVNQPKLAMMLNQLETLSEQLSLTEGKLGQRLRDNDFLNTIRTHQHHSGGVCSQEIPFFHLWLLQPAAERFREISRFFEDLGLMRQTVAMLLSLIRDSALFNSKNAERGFFQTTLDPQQPLQLLRIQLPKQTLFFPETSIGRHGISIRFYALNINDKRRSQTEHDIAFKLSICAI